MNETESSLRNYFFLAGALVFLGLLLSLPDLIKASEAPLSFRASMWLAALIHSGLGAGFISAGLRLHREVRNGTTWIRNFLLASILLLLADAIVAYVLVNDGGVVAQKVAGLFWRLLITVYLLVHLRGLSMGLPRTRS